MVVPSFARATAASALKASPQSDKTRDVMTPEQRRSTKASTGGLRAAKTLKRPSTLSKRDRESIAYNADLHYIKASNPSKPCPLAALPSELRTLIYTYAFDDFQRPVLMNYRRVRHSPSALLQICRAVRIEAAYIYYTSTAFTWTIKNLNFVTIAKWLSNLNPLHRALLSRNENLVIETTGELQKSYTYPPQDYLLDDTIHNHWKACQPFGNLYAVKDERVRINFIMFCRLASWLDLCSKPVYAHVKWRYAFDMPQDSYSKRELNRSLGQHERSVRIFLQHQLKKLWIRNRCEKRIKQHVLDLAEAFIGAYAKMEDSGPSVYPFDDMVGRLNAQRTLVETW
ncbi:uncharacterized protein EKO05_0009208 [Ascochyta rabiei]|uniref:Uncharacterized protein n=1 Tax=Didymella rabiei TaxID=5454 RepID=A0A163INK8_DIDRA|nr:uncharacterized protein EKO05_0009208 [Ascochyta rabiei]KZM25842.1 hypothetical protein ST47_g2995 [Ascochyta rabiei]UPX18926.1 hypothetical protein EKO05_0009208 [Ascochyta rabiei]